MSRKTSKRAFGSFVLSISLCAAGCGSSDGNSPGGGGKAGGGGGPGGSGGTSSGGTSSGGSNSGGAGGGGGNPSGGSAGMAFGGSAGLGTGASGGSGGAAGGINFGPYPAGPYGNNVGDTIADLAWEGYVNESGASPSDQMPYVDYGTDGMRKSGKAYGLVHISAFF